MLPRLLSRRPLPAAAPLAADETVVQASRPAVGDRECGRRRIAHFWRAPRALALAGAPIAVLQERFPCAARSHIMPSSAIKAPFAKSHSRAFPALGHVALGGNR